LYMQGGWDGIFSYINININIYSFKASTIYIDPAF